jgi:hypothetical protein
MSPYHPKTRNAVGQQAAVAAVAAVAAAAVAAAVQGGSYQDIDPKNA